MLAPVYVRKGIDLVLQKALEYKAASSLIDKEVIKQDFISGVIYFSVIILLVALLRGGFLFFMRQTIIVMSRKIEFDQKEQLYRHYQSLDPAFFKKNFTGDLMTRITEDISKVRMYYGPGLMYSINLVVLFVLVVFQMVQVSPMLTLVTLFPLPVMLVCIYYINKKVEEKGQAIQAQLSALSSFTQEAYSGIRIIQSFALTKVFGSRFEQACIDYRQKALSLVRLEAIYYPVIAFLVGIGMISTVYFGGKQVLAGIISPGVIVEFILYLNMVTWPFAAVGWVTALIQQAAVSQQRINELLDTKPQLKSGNKQIHAFNDEIVFDRVTFRYEPTQNNVLQDISFSIKKGTKVAIVGKTGSGKSTLALLLVRAFDCAEGAILVDGTDIRAYDLAAYRRLISYVPQDNFIFSDSIYNNITFGSNEKTEVNLYARMSELDKEVEQFHHGYDTIVGERGVTLSGGQKQRLSIARALAKESPILIFDDAVSAVDTVTEERLMGNITSAGDKTLILITHRLTGLHLFDQIIVIDGGKVAEIGTHDELLQLKGLYFDLYTHQPETEKN